MKEAKEIMGTDWSKDSDLFETLSPLSAMEKLKILLAKGGEAAINSDPQSVQLIKSIAALKNDEINAWVNNWWPNHHQEGTLFYDKQMKHYRDVCRKALNLDPFEEKAN